MTYIFDHARQHFWKTHMNSEKYKQIKFFISWAFYNEDMAPAVPQKSVNEADEIFGLPKWAWAAIAGGVVTAGVLYYIFAGKFVVYKFCVCVNIKWYFRERSII